MRITPLARLISGVLLLGAAAACSKGSGEALDLRSENDLSGLTISCTAGNYYDTKFSKREDVTVFGTTTEADAINAVRQGLADVFVTDEVLMPRDVLDRLGMKLAFLGEDPFDVAYAMKKGNVSLKRQFDEFLASTSVEDIIGHWLRGAEVPPDPNEGDYSGASPLRCIVAQNMEPVGYLGEGGKWYGMDPDILTRFANYLGRPVEFRFMDVGAGIMAIEAGQADLLAGFIFVTEERSKFVDFAAPYYTCHPGYFVSAGSEARTIGFGDRLKMSLITESRWKLITAGLLETLKITVFAILLGTLLGAGVCAARRSRRKWLRSAAGVYGAFIAGIPTLVLLLIMFYVVFASSGLGGSTVAIITFGLCFASSAGNIFDSSISSVPKGQTEAGLSLGFTPLQTFTGIVFPQALRKGLPLFAGECISLLKSTSIVGYIAIQDLTRASDLIRSRTFDALVPLIIITVIYFVLAWVIRKLLNLLLIRK